jgi:hypothetical protein
LNGTCGGMRGSEAAALSGAAPFPGVEDGEDLPLTEGEIGELMGLEVAGGGVLAHRDLVD